MLKLTASAVNIGFTEVMLTSSTNDMDGVHSEFTLEKHATVYTPNQLIHCVCNNIIVLDIHFLSLSSAGQSGWLRGWDCLNASSSHNAPLTLLIMG